MPAAGLERNTPSMPLSALPDDDDYSSNELSKFILSVPRAFAHGAVEENEVSSDARDGHGNYCANWTGFISEAPAIAKHAQLSWDCTEEDAWELLCYFELPSRREAQADTNFGAGNVRRAGRIMREAAYHNFFAGVETFFWRSGAMIRVTFKGVVRGVTVGVKRK